MSRILTSTGAASAATLLSRILGFVRETAFAAFLGTGQIADAFYLALQLPNVLRRLVGDGALTAAFVPMFQEKRESGGPEAGWRFANGALAMILTGVCGACVVIAIVATIVVERVDISIQDELMLRLLRVMLPYVPLVCATAVFIGVLNALGRFFVPTLGAATLNIVLLIFVWFVAPHFGRELHHQVFGLAVGMVAAGLTQALFQIPTLLKAGFRFMWVSPGGDLEQKALLARTLPAVAGVAVFQLSVLATQIFAYTHGPRIVSSFNYAIRLMELPQGLVGVSLATVLLSELSQLSAAKRFPEFRSTLRDGLFQLVFLTLPPVAILLVLPESIVRLLFERGRFDAESTHRVAAMLFGLAPGLMAFSLNSLLARAFYALGDTATPMRVGIASVVMTLTASFCLVSLYPDGGLGIANSVGAIGNTVFLLYALRLKLPKFGFKELISPFGRMLLSGVVAAAFTLGCRIAWSRWIGHVNMPARLGEVFVPMTAGGSAYFGCALALRLQQPRELWAAAAGFFRNPPDAKATDGSEV